MSTIDSMNSKIVVLLSDFGSRDGYVGIMKGAVLSLEPGIRIVDLCHEIEPHNILSGAYVLYTAWDHFPPGTVFCAVVDPGVGSRRGCLLAGINGRTLIAPDNGLVSLLLRMFPDHRVHALRPGPILELGSQSSPKTGRSAGRGSQSGSTFHGRDLFAPAAAVCAAGSSDQIRGASVHPLLLPEVIPERFGGGVAGKILHIDRFGNCISSLHSSDLAEFPPVGGGKISVQAGTFSEHKLCRIYADVPVGAPLCLIGSSGFLEIAVREGSAAERFGIAQGQTLTVTSAAP